MFGEDVKLRAWSGSKLFDALTFFLNEIFENVDFKKKKIIRWQKSLPNFQVWIELRWYVWIYMQYKLSHAMWFPTMWHFDKCSLSRTYQIVGNLMS